MPKRKRDRNPAAGGDAPAEPAPAPSPAAGRSDPGVEPVDPAVADALALFAERHNAERRAEQEARRAKQAAERRASDLERLRKAKEEAVAHLKAVRRQERVAPGELEAAEAAYTAAAADLVTLETGQRPTWAPALPDPTDPEETGDPTGAEARTEQEETVPARPPVEPSDSPES